MTTYHSDTLAAGSHISSQSLRYLSILETLLLYQFTKKLLTVFSMVTLSHDVKDEPITGLVAPDGTDLDLIQVVFSYVLQNALTRM